MNDKTQLQMLGQGFYWQDLSVGQQFRTFRRTVTETDLVNFIGVTGMLEVLFIDAGYENPIGGRPVPAALTQAFIEGMLMQSMLQGTGMAMLEISTKITAPVRVGDSVWADVEVTQVRPTSKSGRAVVTSVINVHNQNSETVLTYTVTRLIAGRPT